LTLVHLALTVERGRELMLILAVGLIGLALETLQLSLRVFEFESASPGSWLPPLWIAALWLQFATLLSSSLHWMLGRPVMAFFAGFAGGPLAFLAGERLGAVAIGEPRLASLAILALVWGLALPTLFVLTGVLKGPGVAVYRPWARPQHAPKGRTKPGVQVPSRAAG